LLKLLLPCDATLTKVRPGLRALSRFAVEYRYPGFHANARKAKTAIRLAERARVETRQRLGLRVT